MITRQCLSRLSCGVATGQVQTVDTSSAMDQEGPEVKVKSGHTCLFLNFLPNSIILRTHYLEVLMKTFSVFPIVYNSHIRSQLSKLLLRQKFA